MCFTIFFTTFRSAHIETSTIAYALGELLYKIKPKESRKFLIIGKRGFEMYYGMSHKKSVKIAKKIGSSGHTV